MMKSLMMTWYKRIADALVETNTATEVNAGLYYRYPVKEMCPGPSFLTSVSGPRCRIYGFVRFSFSR